MTPILKVITQYCDVYVDDIRLSQLKISNPPLYANRMWGYLRSAIPLFDSPFEMQQYFYGTPDSPNLVEPVFATANVELQGADTFTLPQEYTGFELFSAHLKEPAADGSVTLVPLNATYDSETGVVTLETAAYGTVTVDLYTDGYFVKDLSPMEMNILGLFFNAVWTMRFNQDWISNVSKIEDGTFKEQNRANKMNADTERFRQVMAVAVAEMRRFEASVFYKNTFPNGSNIKI